MAPSFVAPAHMLHSAPNKSPKSSSANALRSFSVIKAAAAALASLVLSVASATEEPAPVWPDKIVKFEELRPRTPLTLKVPPFVTQGKVTGPAVLQVHIDTRGAVVKTSLMQSSGNATLDEEAMHAMRAMEFSPYLFGATPEEVTLVVPIHVPKKYGWAPLR